LKDDDDDDDDDDMKAYWGVEMYLHSFLTSALVGGEWSSSLPGRFTLRV
jgi:hypothetical protein